MSIWVCSGQTTIAESTSIDNPTLSNLGRIGEITSLPYVVPEGFVLQIDTMWAESYDLAGVFLAFVWVGDSLENSMQAAVSCNAARGSGTKQLINLCQQFPAGKKINVRLTNNQVGSGSGGIFSWGMVGFLQPVTV